MKIKVSTNSWVEKEFPTLTIKEVASWLMAKHCGYYISNTQNKCLQELKLVKSILCHLGKEFLYVFYEGPKGSSIEISNSKGTSGYTRK